MLKIRRLLAEEEVDKEIWKRLDQGKSYRKIMEELHVGPKRIAEAKRRLAGEPPKQQVFTEAYELFHTGKSRYEVAVELGIKEQEASKLELEYLRLDRGHPLHYLCQAGDTRALMILEMVASALKKIGISPNQYERCFLSIDQIQRLEEKERVLRSSVFYLEQQNRIMEPKNERLREVNSELNKSWGILVDEEIDLECQKERLLREKSQLLLEINDLTHKRNLLLRSRPLWKLREIDSEKHSIELIEDILPCVTDGLVSYTRSNISNASADNLVAVKSDLESHLRESLKEPVEISAKWLAEQICDSLIVENGYKRTSLN